MADQTKIYHLFTCHIGPVQSFIAQARKAQDLFAGSQLLSHLCLAGIEEFENLGGEKILPAYKKEEDKPIFIPNRFLGKIDKPVADLADIGARVKSAIESRFFQVFREALKDELKITPGHYPLGAEEQIRKHLEVYWAFQPVKLQGGASETEEQEAYKLAYHQLNQQLDAVKATRQFSQYEAEIGKSEQPGCLPLSRYVLSHKNKEEHNWGEKGRKCNLDGERNVKFYRLSNDEFQNTEQDQEARVHLVGNKLFQKEEEVLAFDFYHNVKGIDPPPTLRHLQPGEGLSAVSLAKRCFFNDPYKFPSTARVALMAMESRHQQAFQYWQACLKCILDIDPEDAYPLFFEDNLTEKYARKNLSYSSWRRWRNHEKLVLAKYGDFIKKVEKKENDFGKTDKVYPYYALLVFDGDSMGEWWRGRFLEDDGDLEEFHSNLTGCLVKFSEAARLEQPNGATVYAGEDYLGFVSLEHLFPVLRTLRKKFRKMISDKVRENGPPYQIEKDKEITLSAGVAIAHYKEPLGRVLRWAREAEQSSKQYKGKREKDALTLTVLKHAGERVEATWHWDDGEDGEITTFMKELIRMLRTEASSTFIKKMDAVFQRLLGDEGWSTVPRAIVESELERLLRRSLNLPEKQKKDAADCWMNQFRPLLQDNEDTKGCQLGNFLATLNICDFILRKTNGINESNN